MADDHIDSVKWSDSTPTSAELLAVVAQYRGWQEGDRDFYTEGPCPRCKGPTQQGHMTLMAPWMSGLAEGIADRFFGINLFGWKRRHPTVKPAPKPQVPFSCACAHDHGAKDMTGCGAKWVIAWEGPHD